VNGRSRASKIVDLVYFEVDWFDDIVADQLEARVREQVLDVLPGSGKKVVKTDHFVASFDQAIAQMAPEKSCSACDYYVLIGHLLFGPCRRQRRGLSLGSGG
jgi:hypothetical protein